MARFIVAVTGGIASGKSAVTELFSDIGIAVADADLAARTIVEPGQPALEEIADCFGSHFIVEGQLNRQALRELIFDNADAKIKLESITHPRIRELLIKQCKSATSPYAIVAIPLLAEGNQSHYGWINRTIVIDTPRQIQKFRLLSRDKIPEELADKMLDAQASRSQRLAIAHDVISNVHDRHSLKESVQRLDTRYRKLAIVM
ncbi:MAG: dephospho-CoA kinase [Methylococcales bacterium]